MDSNLSLIGTVVSEKVFEMLTDRRKDKDVTQVYFWLTHEP